MKFVKDFKDFSKVSEGLKYHVKNGYDLTDSVYRLGSDAYGDLFEEVKEYWDKGNIILKSKSGWMAKNLEVGKEAIYRPKGKDVVKVKLDTPQRGGKKKFIVYHNSGRTDKQGNIIAKKIEWGDPNLAIKNDDRGRAASFWKRHKCDSREKMDPLKAGFWACYASVFFGKMLQLAGGDKPW